MHKIIVNPLLMKKWQEFHIFAQLTDLWWLTDLYGTPGPVLAPKGPFRGPEGLGRPGESRFGPNCRQLVWLGWNYGYQTLWPGIWPLLGPQGTQKGPIWPKMPLLGVPDRSLRLDLVPTTPERYFFFGSTRYYTIFWDLIRYITRYLQYFERSYLVKN